MADQTGRIVPNPEHPDAGLGTESAPWPVVHATEIVSPSLDEKADAIHAHAVDDVAGLQADLDGKALAVHGHTVSDVSGLQTALDGKAASSHAHEIADVTGLASALADTVPTTDPRLTDARTPTAHQHAAADVTGLGDAATRNVGSVTGTVAAGDDPRMTNPRDPNAHTHAQGDVTGLATALAGKLSTPNTVTALPAEPVANVIYARFADDEDDGHYYWTGSAWRQL